MKTVVIYILLLSGNFCLAQKNELLQLCKGLEERMNQEKPFHLQCQLTVRGRGKDAEEGSITMHLYKNKDMQDLIMGEAEEIIQEGKTMMVINYIQKVIMIGEDTARKINAYAQLSNLQTFVDSASTIEKKNSSGVVTYILSFPEKYIYTNVELGFSERTNQLTSIYAEFSPLYPESYASLFVKYENWDMKWKPGNNFPDLEKFVKKTGNTYVVQDAWKGYKFFQSQKGIMKN